MNVSKIREDFISVQQNEIRTIQYPIYHFNQNDHKYQKRIKYFNRKQPINMYKIIRYRSKY